MLTRGGASEVDEHGAQIVIYKAIVVTRYARFAGSQYAGLLDEEGQICRSVARCARILV